ncbi:peptide chain release factor N(5)-glutamine methyltransferase [Luteimonas yindakuii]|uniref:Release factor glutamine methyltransferase n=1 Tax=Luteimonas yindakuii TaxID=2565782 RepID=A0A4Z1R7S4_9GAMM|nr:peptide chain release factor N(5)-glutamine methyltransferase [Luteimonas yindakuii]TKS54655.1 peptide chain release factor N(5)-glutamine methyltransferase [Luteimonas yindakuii]
MPASSEDCAPRLDAVLRAAAARIDAVDAEWLLLHVLQRPRSWLYAHGDDRLDAARQREFETLLARREAGEPVAYLTGRRGFWTLDLAVTPDTLIPREDTERLVELALERLPPGAPSSVADLGTGSGAIALAIARERPQAWVVATDRSAAALAVAAANADRAGLENVEFVHGDWLAPLPGRRFDLIASNPPYIRSGDPHLSEGDLRFEPASALASGADGLDDIRRIVATAPAHLYPGGWLLLEHGQDQGRAVRDLLHSAGFVDVDTARDLEGRDRVGVGRLAGGAPAPEGSRAGW